MEVSEESKGLLLVFVEPSGALPLDEFHDWYENEHIPLRIELPFFHSATRLVADDNEKPTWSCVYDLATLSSLSTPEYAGLAIKRSEHETDVLKRVQFLERRMYDLLTCVSKEGHSSKALKPGELIVMVSFDMPAGAEDDLHRWYNDEHIEMLSKVPGWLRSRRFVLREAGSNIAADQYLKPPKFLAMHEFDNADAMATEEWKAATSTPWRDKVAQSATKIERRSLKVYKNF